MATYAGPLRQARTETIPQLPDLLPELAQDNHVILAALRDTFVTRGKDPDVVSRADWNKTERYTIAGHFIIQQAEAAVEGTGYEARFKDFRAGGSTQRSLQDFNRSLHATQAAGARQVKADYRESEGFFRNSYTLGARRYRHLGVRAIPDGFVRSAGNGKLWVKIGAAPEGISLGYGMRTKSLGGATVRHMNAMMSVTKNVPEDERLQAAHDLTHLQIGLTAMHLFDVVDRSFKVPPLKAVKDEQTGKYRAVYDNPDESRRWYKSIFSNLPTERHKCPAHVRLPDPETGNRADSALQNMLHAAINASVEFGYYDLRKLQTHAESKSA